MPSASIKPTWTNEVAIGIMRDIFESAESVIVWLGKEEESTSLAFEMTRAISAAIIPTEWTSANVVRHTEPSMTRLIGPLGNSEAHWTALESFMWRSWFTRIWVLQEVGVASSFTIICGKETVKWDHLKATANFLGHPRIRVNERLSLCPAISMADLDVWIRDIQNDLPGHLWDTLGRGRLCDAAEPRDKVYALLGIIQRNRPSTSRWHSMRVNYKLSTAEIYTEFTRLVLEVRLKGLLFVESRILGGNFELDLPSWVPNYATTIYDANGTVALDRENHSAASGLSGSVLPMQQPKILGINALRVDSIEETHDLDVAGRGVYSRLPDLLASGRKRKQLKSLPFFA
jgi:hypothetical protein